MVLLIGMIGRRLLAVIPILLIVSFGVFSLTSLVPGDPAVTLAGGQSATPQSIAAVKRELHLDEPMIVQYFHWLLNALQFNFGSSLFSGSSVTTGIAQTLPVTLSLLLAAILVAVLIGLPLGILAGTKPGGKIDQLSRVISSLGVGVPNFWLASLLVIAFSLKLKWFPSSGFTAIADSPTGWLHTVTLPAIALGFLLAGQVTRLLRTELIRQMDSNYVRTLWAKGLPARVVIGKHAFRSAGTPALTVLGVQIGYLLGGTVIIEQIFAIPGIGTYLLNAILDRDIPVIQGVTMVFVFFQIGMSLLVDIVYSFLNPKVRVS